MLFMMFMPVMTSISMVGVRYIRSFNGNIGTHLLCFYIVPLQDSYFMDIDCSVSCAAASPSAGATGAASAASGWLEA